MHSGMPVRGSWKENFEVHAAALNRVEEGNMVEKEYRARAEELQQAVGDAPPEISVVRFTPGDTRIYQKDSFIGTVLEDAGLPRPRSQDVEDFAMMNVSAEAIPDMGGDVIFTTVYGDEQESAIAEITSDPL